MTREEYLRWDRIDRHGRVLHRGPHGSVSIGAPDQCEYDGCRSTRTGSSRHCSRHDRRYLG